MESQLDLQCVELTFKESDLTQLCGDKSVEKQYMTICMNQMLVSIFSVFLDLSLKSKTIPVRVT